MTHLGPMRAQTTLDFAIAMGVFLVALAFVFAFVPGMFQPFQTNAPETTTFGNRIADQVAGGTLVESEDEVPALDIACTVEFFRAEPTGQPACPFDQSVDVPDRRNAAFTDRLGVETRQNLAVSIEGDTDGNGTQDTLCWDGDNDRIREEYHDDCTPGSTSDVLLDVGTGDPPTQTGSVVVSRRIVSLAGHDATLEVRAW